VERFCVHTLADYECYGDQPDRVQDLVRLSIIIQKFKLTLPLCRYVARSINSVVKSSFAYYRVLALVVESGAIYSSALIIEITLYFLNTNAFYIIYDPIAQLTVSS
jgi:hypothetical protein